MASEFDRNLFQNDFTNCVTGDHPPITPMKAASRNELDGDAWRLYDYITRHFIGSLSPDCTYLTTTATLHINNEVFSSCGKTLLDPGFTTIMPWQVCTQIPMSQKRLLQIYN